MLVEKSIEQEIEDVRKTVLMVSIENRELEHKYKEMEQQHNKMERKYNALFHDWYELQGELFKKWDAAIANKKFDKCRV